MLLSLIKKIKKERKIDNKKGKEKKKTTTIQTKTVTYNSHGLHYRWRCYQEIALNGQHVGPTSFAPLSL